MSLSRSAVAAMLALGSLITPLVPRAEQSGRVYSIGVLSHEISPPADLEAFQKGLRELGYIEGKTWSSSRGLQEARTSGSQLSLMS